MANQKLKTVYLIRHGQSEDNAAPVFQSVDSPLSKNGIHQAEAIAERMADHKVDKIISSPLQRAKQTAEHISRSVGTNVQYSDLFVERIKPKNLNGKPWSDELAMQLWRDWEESLYTSNLRVEDGENYDDIIARADLALNYLSDTEADSIVVVSHGHFIRTLITRVLLGDKLTGPILKHFLDRTSIENTGITILLYKDAFEEGFKWRLLTLNDDTHFTIQPNTVITG